MKCLNNTFADAKILIQSRGFLFTLHLVKDEECCLTPYIRSASKHASFEFSSARSFGVEGTCIEQCTTKPCAAQVSEAPICTNL